MQTIYYIQNIYKMHTKYAHMSTVDNCSIWVTKTRMGNCVTDVTF